MLLKIKGTGLIHYYLRFAIRLEMFLANDDTTPFNPEKTNLACFSNGLVTFGIKDISFNLLSKNEDVFSKLNVELRCDLSDFTF